MEAVVRVTVIYLVILVGLRVMGKREFGSLSPMEFISLLLVPEIVSDTLTGDDPSITSGIIGLATLLGLVFLNSVATHMSPSVAKLIEGEPTVLIHDGTIIERHMNTQRVTPDELYGEMHKAGLERLSQVRWAILESDGKIAFVPKDPADREHRNQQATAHEAL